MPNMTTARVDRTPTHNDLEITGLVHRALAAVQEAGRFGDRKVFIASLWTTMLRIESETSGALTQGATLAHFKVWLLTRDGTEEGARLIVLSRADLVAAMDPAAVAASETVADGATFHFCVDPAIGRDEYAPRARSPKALISRTGRVGKAGESRRAA